MTAAEQYRLAAFEIGQLGPRFSRVRRLIEEAGYGVQEAWWAREMQFEESRGRSDDRVGRPNHTSELLLASFHLYEAEEWQRTGEAVGYFPPVPLGSAQFDFDPPEEAWQQLRDNVDPESSIAQAKHLGVSGFGGELAEAMDTVSPAREEYLRLLLFAPRSEWVAKLDELFDVGERVMQDPGFPTRNSTVDRVAWALSGSYDESGSARMPDAWRTDYVIAVGRARGRLAELDSARQPMFEALVNLAPDYFVRDVSE